MFVCVTVTLYNCSLGREDCSLCKNADPKYQCVWCKQISLCVYDQLCASKELEECPDPQITDVSPESWLLWGIRDLFQVHVVLLNNRQYSKRSSESSSNNLQLLSFSFLFSQILRVKIYLNLRS